MSAAVVKAPQPDHVPNDLDIREPNSAMGVVNEDRNPRDNQNAPEQDFDNGNNTPAIIR
jgi:hypothetical protein